jgi:hypothetical protein
MAHEHSGDCCAQHEHQLADVQQAAIQLGSLCCSGRCHHPEHQYIRDLLEQQYMQERADEPSTVAVAKTDTKSERKKRSSKDKKKYAPLFGQLLTKAA